jgi:selenocysteine lyase/cysteine desulfurase
LGGPFGGGFLLMSFKYLNKDQDIFDGDDGEDVYANEKQLQARLEYFESQLAGLSEGAPTDERIKSLLEIGRIQVERYKGADAWEKAFTAFNLAPPNSQVYRHNQVLHPYEKIVHCLNWQYF